MKKIPVAWHDTAVEIPGIPEGLYNTETGLAVFCADWLRKQFELTKNPGFDRWHHSANERAGARAGFLAKMMGQAKGFPDLVHFGLELAVELKMPGRVPSIEQKEWLKYFESIGWTAKIICRFEEFRDLVESWTAPA